MSTKDVSQINSSPSLMMGVIGVTFFILLMLLIFGTCTETGRQYYENIKNKFVSNKKDIKSLDIVMFMSPGCPFCIKMLDVLKKEGQLNNITIVDVTKKEGIDFAKQVGADKQPLPSFICRTLKTSTVGSKETVNDLVADLSRDMSSNEPSVEPSSGEIDVELVGQLQIILFSKNGCPWCTKAKAHCEQMGVTNMIQIVDVNTPEGQSLAKNMLPPEVQSVPAWVSVATGKHTIGFEPLVSILQKLK